MYKLLILIVFLAGCHEHDHDLPERRTNKKVEEEIRQERNFRLVNLHGVDCIIYVSNYTWGEAASESAAMSCDWSSKR